MTSSRPGDRSAPRETEHRADNRVDPQAEEQRILDQLSSDERLALEQAEATAQDIANAVMAHLETVADLINRALPDGPAMTLLGANNRVKGLASLARKYVGEQGDWLAIRRRSSTR